MKEQKRLNDKLKQKNLRLTRARTEIYKLLSESKHSLSAKEVHEQISHDDESHTDLVSVYRNLSLFTELGLAHRFQDGKYSSCHQHDHDHHDHDNSLESEHIHFINHCTGCGKSSEIKAHSKKICELAMSLKKLSSSLKTYNEIIIQGYCADCS